jgi:hypothetical protein
MNEQKEALKNVFDSVENYTKTSVELYKLKLINKSSEIIADAFIGIALLVMALFFFSFINIALAFLIGNWMGSYPLGFLIVSSFYLLLACLVYIFKSNLSESLIENLLLKKFLSNTLENEK